MSSISRSSAAFERRSPVVFLPMCVVYDVRSNSCSSAPNTISTCSTELRSPISRLSTRERTRRPPSCASAHCSVAPSPMVAARCWIATTLAGNSWRLATRSDAPSPTTISIVPAKNDCPASVSAASDGTNSSTIETRAPAPTRTSVRVSKAVSGAPRAQRITIGLSRVTPAGTSTTTPWLQKARVSCANLSLGMSASVAISSLRTASRSSVSGRRPMAAAAAASDNATVVRRPSVISMIASASAGSPPPSTDPDGVSTTTVASSSWAARRSI